MLATLKEFQLATLSLLPFFTPCNALVSELVIVLNDSPCEGIGK
jgi:hypothetical protein